MIPRRPVPGTGACRPRTSLGALPGLVALSACSGQSPPEAEATQGEVLFADATAASGLAAVRHYSGFTPYRYLIETMGGGVGLFDADGDGWLDAYLVNGAPLPEGETPPEPPINRLFLGSESGRFRDATERAGLGDPGFGMGCAVADADGDGDPDLLVTNVGPNAFFANAGDGRFEERSAASGLDHGGWGVSAGFFDADRDGDLDLYLVNYVEFTRAIQREHFPDGRADFYPHPDLFDAERDAFYTNDGGGVFTDASRASGTATPLPGKGLGIALADVEGDGDTDVYVANDSTPNFLFVNDGSGRFEELAVLAGCAYNEAGQTEASMGVDFGDADGDGLPELFMTHLDVETNTFYANASAGAAVELTDRTRRVGVGPPSVKLTGFGTAFLDWDHDGHRDLLVVNGHIIDNVEKLYSDRDYPQPDLLFRGRGDGTFEDVSARAGPYFAQKRVGRGAAFGDIDRDGDIDVLIGTCGGAPIVLENRAGAGHWIQLELAGGAGDPADGQGARVTLTAGGRAQVDELWTAYSYASASDAVVHFGLGAAVRVDSVEVRWPSGRRERWSELAADTRYRLVSGVESAEVVWRR